ncbi:RpnC/YadD family protein [Spirosoma rhododendri]|uniref:Uncharacterized protein n=1 Tax=Spirosoma rhododendri TaxID=2728024 RepID=A0A7L5DSF0_9BACT|nr:hypothetical protein [Spirosoma rhododendri]QJD78887.1 hypothetical protein HH216_10935 [Spirosoma rhododendri]
MNRKTDKREGNQYDKIVKENIDSIIPALMSSVLGFRVEEAVVIREKLQQTKEKEADALRIVTAPGGAQFILHLEFQVDDYLKMVFRMADYWVLLKSKYGLPVRQFVIYIGNQLPKMKTVLTEDGNYFQFQLINITQFDYLRFLTSDNPEEVILSVLADFDREKSDQALGQIIHRLEETTPDQRTFQKHMRQLRVLSKLRNLDLKFDDMIQNMDKYIDAENDYLYIRAKKEIISNLLTNTDFAPDRIAQIAGVSPEFVRTVQQEVAGK